MDTKEININDEFFKQFRTASDLEGFLQSILKRGVEKILTSELDDHLGYSKGDVSGAKSGNSRNGTTIKKLKSALGETMIEVPRDRNSTFEPVIVPKRKSVIDRIETIVISLYAKGMSTRDIEAQIKEIYGVTISSSSISNITEQVMIDVEEWQKRPLDNLYLIIWMDGISFKVRQNGKIINKSIYIIIGLNTSGKKEVLGMWVNETESASFWMHVLSEIKSRGVQEVLIACSDNLKGLTQAIKASFTDVVPQLCIVHQIRNSLRFIGSKDKREFTKQLKEVYGAINLEEAQNSMQMLENKWASKYPYAIKSWYTNWDELTAFFAYPPEIRRIIYTTNIIENFNRGVRKITKNKTMFPDDNAVKKAVYLAIQNITNKWTKPVMNWSLIANQFSILYADKFEQLNIVLTN